MFPEQLASDHIESWSNAGDVVLDPFLGSGTTARMAIMKYRHYIGFEVSEEYYDIAHNRVNSALTEREERSAWLDRLLED